MSPKNLFMRCYSQTRLLIKLVTAAMAGKKAGFFKSFGEAVPFRMAMRFFDRQPLSKAHKNCPNCGGQVPVAALFCDACDYNFIASIVGHRHKLLNPPTIPEAVHQASVR